MEILKKKKVIRTQMKEALEVFTQTLSSTSSPYLSAADEFTSSVIYRNASLIVAYMAMKKEFNIDEIIRRALEDGKKVAVPRINTEKNIMEFRLFSALSDFSKNMKLSSFGIREPNENMNLISVQEIAFENSAVLVPGLAFTLSGFRLGRGKGYYDVFLSELKKNSDKCVFCGVCFAFQLMGEIPFEEHDVKMNYILTENSISSVSRTL